MSIQDLLVKAGAEQKKTSGGIQGLLSSATPIEETPQAPVQEVYPEAVPEKQTPESFFKRYQDWSNKTGQKIGAIGENVTKTFGTETGREALKTATVKGGIPSAKSVFQNYNDLAYGVMSQAFSTVGASTLSEQAKGDKIMARAKAKQAGLEVQKFIQEYDMGEDPRTFMQKISAPGGEKEIAKQIGLQVPTFLALLGVGVASRGLSLPATFTTSFALNAGDAYQQAKDYVASEGREFTPEDEKKMSKVALLVGASTAPLDTFSMGRILGPGKTNLIKQTFTRNIMEGVVDAGLNTVIEGGTEAIQEITQNAWARTYNENQDLFEGVSEATFTGGLFGGGATVTLNAAGLLLNAKTKEEEKQKIEETGIAEDVRNVIETNGREAAVNEIGVQLGVERDVAERIVSIAIQPSLPSQEQITRDVQAIRDSTERRIALTRTETSELVPKVEEMLKRAKQATEEELASLEEELKAVRAELEKRGDDEIAKTTVEAMKLLPAPKGTGVITQQKIEKGDTIKIKTKATGTERKAEVVEVRPNGVVAVAKGDANFPESPLFYKSEKFETAPVRKAIENLKKENKAKELATFVAPEELEAKAEYYRNKAEVARKAGSEELAKLFEKKADEAMPEMEEDREDSDLLDRKIKAQKLLEKVNKEQDYVPSGVGLKANTSKQRRGANLRAEITEIDIARNKKAEEKKSAKKEIAIVSIPDKIASILEKVDGVRLATDEQIEEVAELPVKQAQENTDVVTMLSEHKDYVERLKNGDTTPEELNQKFGDVVARKDEVVAYLSKKTKEELAKEFRFFLDSRSKKDHVIDMAWRNIVGDYNPSDAMTWMPFSETYEQAVAKRVSAATAEDISAYAKKIAEMREERKKRLEEREQAVKDPQTLEQFRIFISVNGVESMSNEQRVRYDSLIADKIKEDTEKEKKQKALVRGVNAGVSMELKQTKHTKTGEDLYVVTMANRVENDVYRDLVSTAKRLGGWYSSFRGTGAIPGFQFKTKEDAENFMRSGSGETVDTSKKIEAKDEARKIKTTSKLMANAEVLEEKSIEEVNRDRKTNTSKRAREAAGSIANAENSIMVARTMKNLASAIALGKAKYLDDVTTQADIYQIEAALRRAKWKEVNAKFTEKREEHAQEPITDETINYADNFFPEYTARTFHEEVLKPMSQKKGWKLLSQRYIKRVPETDDFSVRWTPKTATEAMEAGQLIRAAGLPSYSGLLREAQDYTRWVNMGVKSLPQLRAILREYVTFRSDPVEMEDQAKKLERELVGKKVGIDFFPTPKKFAEQMVEQADIRSGMKVLEPSAGNGNIAEVIRDAGVDPEVMEISPQLKEVLVAKGFDVVGDQVDDFMEYNTTGYDRIVMNPPFSKNQDIAHVRHAFDLLKPGGRVVAIVGEGAFFRSGKTEAEFRNWLDSFGAVVEPLPAGTFQDTSLLVTTGTNARLVIIDKPEVDFARKYTRDEHGRFASEEPASSVVQMVRGDEQVFYRVPQSQFEEMKGIIDTPSTEKATGIADRTGRMFHLTAKTPEQMLDRGFTDGGWITSEYFAQPDFARQDLTLKTLERLEGKTTVSKQFISDLTNNDDLKQAERELIRSVLEGEGEKVNVPDFINKVRMELLPLKRMDQRDMPAGFRGARYENITLPDELRGLVNEYRENIYNSPIKTSAGEVHFGKSGGDSYFAHTRIEDMADGQTRRVIEAQSDLFQKGRLEGELGTPQTAIYKGKEYTVLGTNSQLSYLQELSTEVKNSELTFRYRKEREDNVARLEPYRNTWQDRIIREEVAQAAKDGKTKLQFPTGETAMKIEGLGSSENFVISGTRNLVKIEDLRVGEEITHGIIGQGQDWVITDVLGDGKFKAVPKEKLDGGMKRGKEFSFSEKLGENEQAVWDRIKFNYAEEFDISGNIDKENPIYKFYEKEVGRYLKNRYKAERVTDAQGVEWYEVTITPEMAGPVLAFREQEEGSMDQSLSGPIVDEDYVRSVVAEFTSRLNLDVPVSFVDTIYTGEKTKAMFAMDGKEEDVQAWAATFGKNIVFTKKVPEYTPAHEILHFVLNNLDKMVADFGYGRMEVLTAANNGVIPATSEQEQELGEDLARRFEAVWTGKKNIEKGVLARFFEKLVEYVRAFLRIPRTDAELIKDFYDKVLYMRRSGEKVTDRNLSLAQYESSPGVLNFGSRADYARITPDEFDALSPEEQDAIVAREVMEEIRGDITSPKNELVDSVLSGKRKIRIGGSAMTEAKEALGSTYMRVFRNDATLSSMDELVQEVRDQGQEYSVSEFLDEILARDAYRKMKNAEMVAYKARAMEARKKQTALAKTEAERRKILKGIERDLVKKMIEKRYTIKQYVQAIERGEKRGAKSVKSVHKSRAQKVNAIKDALKLTDAEVRSILGRRDYRIMDEKTFDEFLFEMEARAQIVREHSEARVQLLGTIYNMELNHVENLQEALGMSTRIDQLTVAEMRKLEQILSGYQVGDTFLGVRTLQTIDRTSLSGIRTYREVREKQARKMGVPESELAKTKVSEFDKFRWDAILAEKNPLYRLMVKTLNEAFLTADMRSISVEKKFNALIREARKSRRKEMSVWQKVVASVVPTDEQIFAYLEAPQEAKIEMAKHMTDQEMVVALFVQQYYAIARDHLVANEMLKEYRENYITHIRRSFLEAWKDDGVKQAVKEIIEQEAQDEAVFTILDEKTGEILPLEKYFSYTMRRSGKIEPTQNVARAFLGYAKQFERKKAYDSILPEIHVTALALTPRGRTEAGLPLDDSLSRFVNKWVNSKKGRRAEPLWNPGGKIDWAVRTLDMLLTIKFLGLNIPTGLTSQIGEMVTEYIQLGTRGYALGLTRLATPKGREFVKKYENFVGRTPWDALQEQMQGLPSRVLEFTMMGLFKSGTVRANKIHLLGSLTKEEWSSGSVSSERLAQMKLDLGRWRVVEGAESVWGKTTLGSVVKRFKTWAIVIADRVLLQNLPILIKTVLSKGAAEAIKTREFREFFRMTVLSAAVYLIVVSMVADDIDDIDEALEYKKGETFLEELRRKAIRDAYTVFSALNPETLGSVPIMLDWLVDFSKALGTLVRTKEYKTTKKGEYQKGDLKGINQLQKVFTPSALNHIMK